MRVDLYVRLSDIDLYERGEEIEAADISGKSAIFNKIIDHPIQVSVPISDIIVVEDFVSRGMVSGTFKKYFIKNN